MERKKLDVRLIANVSVIGLLIINLGVMFVIIQKTSSEGGLCQTNPLVYGVDKLSKENGALMTCTCSVEGKQGLLIVTNNSMEFESTIVNPYVPPELDAFIQQFNSSGS